MRKAMTIFGVAVGAMLLMTGAAFAYVCPGVVWITFDIPDSSNGVRVLHLDSVVNGAIKVGSCSHDPFLNGPTRTTLYETVPGGNNKVGASKSSEADCDALSPFNGKVSRGGVKFRAYHAMLSFDDSGINDHIHACVEGPVTIFEH
jgi:hypothetical protein